MKFNVETQYLDPIELDRHEWVDVKLPSGKVVTVFDDEIRVATPEQHFNHQNGKKVWAA